MKPELIVIYALIACCVIWLPVMVYSLMKWATFPPPPPPFEVWATMSEEERLAYRSMLDRWCR